MLDSKVGGFRLLCSSILCVLIGLPLGGFGGLQSFMLQRHIYESRCTVSFGGPLPAGGEEFLICAESRAAYVALYTTSGLGYALAMIPAYFALKYVGYLFSSICCAIMLAAGSVVITDPVQDRWGHDKHVFGLSLLAAAAPFALLNNINDIASISKSANGILGCMVTQVAAIQLGPLLWPLLARRVGPAGTVDDLFRTYLWIPCCALIMVLLLMPFPDIVPHNSHFREFLNVCKKCFGFAVDSVTDDELVPLIGHERDPDTEANEKPWNYASLKLFAVAFLSYLAHSLPMDLMLVSGQVRANLDTNTDVSLALAIFSPIIASGVVPLVLTFSRTVTLNTLYLSASASCTLSLVLQLVSQPLAWQLSALSANACRLFLLWFIISCAIRCLGAQAYFLVGGVFVATAAVSWLFLPLIDRAFVFGVDILGHSASAFGLGFQAVAIWFMSRFLRNISHVAKRDALDQEANQAFGHAP